MDDTNEDDYMATKSVGISYIIINTFQLFFWKMNQTNQIVNNTLYFFHLTQHNPLLIHLTHKCDTIKKKTNCLSL